jgi:hypothetical protein
MKPLIVQFSQLSSYVRSFPSCPVLDPHTPTQLAGFLWADVQQQILCNVTVAGSQATGLQVS